MRGSNIYYSNNCSIVKPGELLTCWPSRAASHKAAVARAVRGDGDGAILHDALAAEKAILSTPLMQDQWLALGSALSELLIANGLRPVAVHACVAPLRGCRQVMTHGHPCARGAAATT